MTKDKNNRTPHPTSPDRGKVIDDSVLYGGKVPPQSRELEMNLLGGVIIDNSLLDLVQPIISEKHFYVTANALVWRAINRLRDRNQPADLITITEELKTHGDLESIGGPLYLAELSTVFSSTESIVFSAEKVRENWVRRDLILLTFGLNEQCYDPTINTEDLLNKAQSEIIQVGAEMHGADTEDNIDRGFERLVEDTENRRKRGDEMTGIPSHSKDLNELTGGWQRGELHIIAGRPSHGKSADGIQELVTAVNDGYKCGMFSIEMGEKQFMARLAAMIAEVDMLKFKYGNLTDDDFKKLITAAKWVKQHKDNLMVDYSNPTDVNKIKAKSRLWKRKYGLDMIMVDYAQICGSGNIPTRFENTNKEVGLVGHGLKQLAKELDIAALLLSQMSRDFEKRPLKDRRPYLSDLRESGELEQHADTVLFIVRPELFLKKDDPEYAKVKDLADFYLAKQRNGPVGEFKHYFRGTYGKFERYSAEYESNMPGNYNQTQYYSRENEPF